jgi:uncharacterized protein
MKMHRSARAMFQQWTRLFKQKIIHINDSPHRIARGVALGFFIAWTPAIGTHILMVLALSFIMRANKIAALVSIWINNPFTMIPMYYPGYLVGRSVVSSFTGRPGLKTAQVMELFKQFDSVGDVLVNFHRPEFWHGLFQVFLRIGIELWVGCILLGILTAAIGYLATYRFIVWHRLKRMHLRSTYIVSIKAQPAAIANQPPTTSAQRSHISG